MIMMMTMIIVMMKTMMNMMFDKPRFFFFEYPIFMQSPRSSHKKKGRDSSHCPRCADPQFSLPTWDDSRLTSSHLVCHGLEQLWFNSG